MSRFRSFAVALASLLVASTAQAQVLLSDSFTGLNGGNSQLNYASFPNWTVLNGTVDLIKSGDFGITCAGGTGSCVDMDGSRNASGTIGTQTFFFGAGETFNLSFDLSGNQRGGAQDGLGVRFNFGTTTAFTNNTGTGYMAGLGSGLFAPTYTNFASGIAPTAPWTTSTFSFTFVNAGQVSVDFYTSGNDNVGPVLDNVVISKSVPQNVVPEPSTYALMAAGLAAMGVVARRRRRA
ncbi:MAG: PEP-CTERM sorting domain-containing protein [Gemmatimonadetes bacterium]|nr:PEP-CTERM sorting domain-containing protein [Gemmatimonadota bacterium]